uniref:gem-associated protein 2-like n=1 Tax=Styela clava TaxID=7725 RepID=UPI0019394D28|nr:gem-associated protein 2-like [Styela clava]
MASLISVTGESLHEEEIDDAVPGATPFFKVDFDEIEDGEIVPMDKLPSNPQEYLRGVMQQARNTPNVVVAKIDPSKIKPKLKPAIPSKYLSEQVTEVRSDLIPSKEWQEQQLVDFATTREEYIRHLAKLKSISRQTKKRPKLPIYPLPPWEDEESWKFLCFGRNLKRKKQETDEDNNENTISQGAHAKESDEDDNLQNALIAGGRTTADILADQINSEEDRTVDLSTLEEGFPPMMRILLRMDSNQVEANLEYHTRWMEEDGFSHEQGRWMYALLSCLEKPLFPTVISVLRELSRKCKELRSRLDPQDKTSLNGLNLIICIVGRYFDQTDLADPW